MIGFRSPRKTTKHGRAMDNGESNGHRGDNVLGQLTIERATDTATDNGEGN